MTMTAQGMERATCTLERASVMLCFMATIVQRWAVHLIVVDMVNATP